MPGSKKTSELELVEVLERMFRVKWPQGARRFERLNDELERRGYPRFEPPVDGREFRCACCEEMILRAGNPPTPGDFGLEDMPMFDVPPGGMVH